MDGIMHSIIAFLLTVEFIIGYLANGFIVLVNCLEWIKRKKICFADQIVTILAISRIAFLLSLLTIISDPMLYSGFLFIRSMLKMTNFTWIVTNHLCMWLGTCLSLFYFLKIANFANVILVYLRWRVQGVVLVVMLASLFLLGLHIALFNSHIDGWIDSCKDNLANCSSLKSPVEFYKFPLILACIFISIPFTLSQSTFLLLILSLWKHVKRMRDNVQGYRDASTTAHIRALRVMVTSALLCSAFFLGFLLQLWRFQLLQSQLFVRFCQAAGVALPSVHSCVLILGNTKLRQTLISMLWWLYRSKDVKCSYP